MKCPVCRRPVPAPTGRAGRPAIYCRPSCAELARTLASVDEAYSRLVDDIRAEGCGEDTALALSSLRGRLWSIGNASNTVGRCARGPNRAPT